MERIGIRQLKDGLSHYLELVRHGGMILVTDRGKPVARLVPVEDEWLADLSILAERNGIHWQGGKPTGYPGPALEEDHALARAVAEERDSRQ